MTRPRDSLERLCRRVREHEEPSAGDRAFVRAQLSARIAAAGVAAAAAAGAGKAAAASGAPALGASGAASIAGANSLKLGLAGAGAWVAGGASMTAAAVLIVQSLSGAPERSPVPPTPSAAAAASARAHPVAQKRPSAASQAPLDEPLPAPATPPRESLPVVTPKRSPVRVTSSAKPSLAEEAQSLARVQRALRDGDATTALRLLDEQDRRFRGGSLAAERSAARALAGCAAGRAQARVQAERYVAEHAGSPLAERVQRRCFGPR